MTNKETYIFSKVKAFKLLINHAEWLVICSVFIIFACGLLSDKLSTTRAISGTFFFAIIALSIVLTVILYYRKFAYKIVFDFQDNTASFYMLRKQGVTIVNLSDIEKIVISYRITFCLKNKRIKYHEDGINDKLIAFLDKNFEVESGLFRYLPFPFK